MPSNFEKLAILITMYQSAVIRAMLMQTGFTYNQDTHQYVSDISASEVVDGGGSTTYVRQTIANKTFTQDNTNDLAYMDCDDLLWASILLSPAGTDGVLFYVQIGGDDTTPGDDRIIDFKAFTSTFTTTGGDLPVPISGNGLIRIL